MILVDTSIWIDYLAKGDDTLRGLIEAEQVIMHPIVLGELACGDVPDRAILFENLYAFKLAPIVLFDEAMRLIETQRLMGRGLAWGDVQLLASALIAPDLRLLTRDKRLRRVAEELGVAANLH